MFTKISDVRLDGHASKGRRLRRGRNGEEMAETRRGGKFVSVGLGDGGRRTESGEWFVVCRTRRGNSTVDGRAYPTRIDSRTWRLSSGSFPS